MARKRTRPKPLGGNWWLLPDDTKIQGRDKAYRACGLDPAKFGNRRSDASKQRRRQTAIADRRRKVAALMTSKVPMRTMAEAVGVSLKTVQTDTVAIKEEWKETQRREIEDFAISELAALEEDEYRLRLRYQAAIGDDTKNRIFDRILRVMQRRTKLIGLEPPDVRRVAVSVTAKVETEVVFRAGGTEAEYVNTLRRAQGLEIVK